MAIGEYRIGEKMSDEDSLAHYGVKGMKWGVRKKVLGGMEKTGFASAARKNAMNAKKRTAIGVAVGQTIGGGFVARKLKERNGPDSSGVTRKQARTEIRKSDRETSRRLEDFETGPNRSNMIRSARANAVAANRKYEDVRDEIKAGKGSGAIGKNQARILLAKAGNERYETLYKADSRTTGEQFMDAMFSAPRARQ